MMHSIASSQVHRLGKLILTRERAARHLPTHKPVGLGLWWCMYKSSVVFSFPVEPVSQDILYPPPQVAPPRRKFVPSSLY